ncbi:hypothetical protein D3C83_229220 [compost metagenome]
MFVPQNLRAGVYSNLANITITENELVIDFLNVNAKDNPSATLVSRVILPPKHGKALAETIKNLLDKEK